MPTTSKIPVSGGSGYVVSAYQISETDPGDASPTSKLLQRVAFNDASGNDVSGDGGIIWSGIYETVPSAAVDGAYKKIHVNEMGYTIVTSNDVRPGEDVDNDTVATIFKPIIDPAYMPSNYHHVGTDNSTPATNITAKNVKNSEGAVYSFTAYNFDTAKVWLFILDRASDPANGNTPLRRYLVPAGTANNPGERTRDIKYLASLIHCALGVSWAFSTSPLVYTAPSDPSKYALDLNYD